MKIAGQQQREAVARVLAGETYAQAARAVGLSRSAVAGACHRANVKVGRLRPGSVRAIRDSSARIWGDPERGPAMRQKISSAAKARWHRYRQNLKQIEGGHEPL